MVNTHHNSIKDAFASYQPGSYYIHTVRMKRSRDSFLPASSDTIKKVKVTPTLERKAISECIFETPIEDGTSNKITNHEEYPTCYAWHARPAVKLTTENLAIHQALLSNDFIELEKLGKQLVHCIDPLVKIYVQSHLELVYMNMQMQQLQCYFRQINSISNNFVAAAKNRTEKQEVDAEVPVTPTPDTLSHGNPTMTPLVSTSKTYCKE